MRVAALQLQSREGLGVSLQRAAELIDSANSAGARLVLLPEFFSIPFVGEQQDFSYFDHAEPMDGPSNELVRGKSAQLHTTIVSSIFERATVPGTYHNTTCIFSDGRLLSVYRKSHLPFSNGFPEKFYFRPGDAPPRVVTVDEVGVGTIICYERHYPELARIPALEGASILCVPVAASSAPSKEVFQLELRAHAVFNRYFVVCANRVGVEGGKTYYGMSAIYAPDGTVVAQAGERDEDIVVAEIDLNAVAQQRQRMPLLRDRRPELYGQLAALPPPDRL